MKFGKSIRREMHNHPNLYYLDYKNLKKLIKNISSHAAEEEIYESNRLHEQFEKVLHDNLRIIEETFLNLFFEMKSIKNDIEKNFTVGIDEDIKKIEKNISFDELLDVLKEKNVSKEFFDFCIQLSVLSNKCKILRTYVIFNYIGLIKILKKKKKHCKKFYFKDICVSDVLSKYTWCLSDELPKLITSVNIISDEFMQHFVDCSVTLEKYICPICLCLINDPVTLNTCFHSFCWNCLATAIQKFSIDSCPICRTKIMYDSNSIKIDGILSHFLKKYFANNEVKQEEDEKEEEEEEIEKKEKKKEEKIGEQKEQKNQEYQKDQREQKDEKYQRKEIARTKENLLMKTEEEREEILDTIIVNEFNIVNRNVSYNIYNNRSIVNDICDSCSVDMNEQKENKTLNTLYMCPKNNKMKKETSVYKYYECYCNDTCELEQDSSMKECCLEESDLMKRFEVEENGSKRQIFSTVGFVGDFQQSVRISSYYNNNDNEEDKDENEDDDDNDYKILEIMKGQEKIEKEEEEIYKKGNDKENISDVEIEADDEEEEEEEATSFSSDGQEEYTSNEEGTDKTEFFENNIKNKYYFVEEDDESLGNLGESNKYVINRSKCANIEKYISVLNKRDITISYEREKDSDYSDEYHINQNQQYDGYGEKNLNIENERGKNEDNYNLINNIISYTLN